MSDGDAPRPPETDGDTPDAEVEEGGDERVQLTPGLVVMGIVAVALGIFSALVMSARALGP